MPDYTIQAPNYVGSHEELQQALANPRPVKVTVIITGRDGETTSYAMDVASAEEERTKAWGHPLDVRFTFSDVEYLGGETPPGPEDGGEQ